MDLFLQRSCELSGWEDKRRDMGYFYRAKTAQGFGHRGPGPGGLGAWSLGAAEAEGNLCDFDGVVIDLFRSFLGLWPMVLWDGWLGREPGRGRRGACGVWRHRHVRTGAAGHAREDTRKWG